MANTSRTAEKSLLVKGIWLYFLLLIFEGALRKWVLPSLSAPLLIVRDPVAIGLLLYAWYYNIFPKNIFIVWMFIISGVSIFTTLFVGHGNLSVTLYGARILLIHFPLIFLIGYILNRKDVLQIGRVLLWISIPMAVLIAMQFYSSQSAWVNRGVGGDLSGAGFSGSMGYYRPPGTFSFTNGAVAFFGLAAAFIFYFWMRSGKINKVILIGATVGLIFAIPFSISRTLSFTVALTLIFVVFTLTRNPKFFGKVFIGIAGFMVLFIVLHATGLLDTPIEVFLSRFEKAGKAEGGLEGTIGERYIGGMLEAIADATEQPFFGQGLGMGTNAGAVMLGAGRTFLISEGEWGRIIGEMGALLGLGVIAIRLIVTLKVTIKSYFKIQSGDILPWLILSFAITIFPQGQWAQPTTLGFSTLVMGLLIASFNKPEQLERNSSIIEENTNSTQPE